MRRAIIFAVLLLSGCFGDAKLKADTEADFNNSFAEVTKPLGAEDKQKLNLALKDIAMVEKGLYGPMLAAKNYRLPSRDTGTLFGANVSAALISSASQMIDTAVSANWEQNRAKVVVENARSIVDGRTVEEIISIAQDERKKATESTIAIYQAQLDQAKAALRDLQTEAAKAAQRHLEQSSLLDRVVISRPSFSYQKDSFTKQPVVSFTISNKGKIPVKRIFVEGNLQTPGRAVPWVNAPFNYEIHGGLEPNETQNLNLAPNMFSDWGKVPEEAVKSAILIFKVTAFEDASGTQKGSPAPGDNELESKKKALEDAVQELERKIADLQKSGS